eukprot:365428-Chlamydomonas_euryale.AAC.6
MGKAAHHPVMRVDGVRMQPGHTWGTGPTHGYLCAQPKQLAVWVQSRAGSGTCAQRLQDTGSAALRCAPPDAYAPGPCAARLQFVFRFGRAVWASLLCEQFEKPHCPSPPPRSRKAVWQAAGRGAKDSRGSSQGQMHATRERVSKLSRTLGMGGLRGEERGPHGIPSGRGLKTAGQPQARHPAAHLRDHGLPGVWRVLRCRDVGVGRLVRVARDHTPKVHKVVVARRAANHEWCHLLRLRGADSPPARPAVRAAYQQHSTAMAAPQQRFSSIASSMCLKKCKGCSRRCQRNTACGGAGKCRATQRVAGQGSAGQRSVWRGREVQGNTACGRALSVRA